MPRNQNKYTQKHCTTSAASYQSVQLTHKYTHLTWNDRAQQVADFPTGKRWSVKTSATMFLKNYFSKVKLREKIFYYTLRLKTYKLSYERSVFFFL